MKMASKNEAKSAPLLANLLTPYPDKLQLTQFRMIKSMNRSTYIGFKPRQLPPIKALTSLTQTSQIRLKMPALTFHRPM